MWRSFASVERVRNSFPQLQVTLMSLYFGWMSAFISISGNVLRPDPEGERRTIVSREPRGCNFGPARRAARSSDKGWPVQTTPKS